MSNPLYSERVQRSYVHDRREGRNRERVVTKEGVVIFEKVVDLRSKNAAPPA